MNPDFVIPQPATVAVPVLDSDKQFPVRRVYCVGRNCAAHVKEMGGDERDPPFFFQKPKDAIVHNGATVPGDHLIGDIDGLPQLQISIGEPD